MLNEYVQRAVAAIAKIGLAAPDAVAIEGVRREPSALVVVGLVKGQRPESVDRRQAVRGEPQDIAIAADERIAGRIGGCREIHRFFARQQAKAGERAFGAHQVVGAEVADFAGGIAPALAPIAVIARFVSGPRNCNNNAFDGQRPNSAR